LKNPHFGPCYPWPESCEVARNIVIRITVQQESLVTRLFLEGKLSGPCVDELDKCWQTCPSSEMALLVDLSNVSFVDEHGKELLAHMHKKGIKLFSNSVMTKCLIEEIESTPVRSGDQISSRGELLSPHQVQEENRCRG
jgi:hypothetical protein